MEVPGRVIYLLAYLKLANILPGRVGERDNNLEPVRERDGYCGQPPSNLSALVLSVLGTILTGGLCSSEGRVDIQKGASESSDLLLYRASLGAIYILPEALRPLR